LNYPYGYHFLLSFLHAGAVRWLDRYSALLYDLTIALSAAAILRAYGDLSATAVMALSACYLLLPGLSLVQFGPRAFALTPRSFSQCLVGGAFLLLAWETDLSTVLTGSLAVLLLAIALCSSKFALQVLLFVAPLASALSWDARPAVAALLASAVALLLSRGYLARQVRGQLAHLRWYARSNRGLVAERREAPPLLQQLRRRAFGSVGLTLLNRNVLTSALIRHPIVLLAAALFVIDRTRPPSLALYGSLAAAAVVPFVVTSIGPAQVLGRPERYLEFVTPTAWVFFWGVLGLDHFGLSLGIIGSWSASLYVVNLWTLFHRGHLPTETQVRERAELRRCLREHAPCVVLSVDLMEAYQVIDRPHGVRVCTVHGWTGTPDVESFLSRSLLRFPYVDPERVDDLVTSCGADFVLLSTASVDRVREAWGVAYDLPPDQRLFTGEAFELYRSEPAPAAGRAERQRMTGDHSA
jgi:hypothetical protein